MVLGFSNYAETLIPKTKPERRSPQNLIKNDKNKNPLRVVNHHD
jgi:hypothetical protein